VTPSSNPLTIPPFPEDTPATPATPARTESRQQDPFDDTVPAATVEQPRVPSPPAREVTHGASVPAPTPVPAPDKTTLIPDKTTIASNTKEIRLLFKSDYANRDVTARAAFAERLGTSAYQTNNDPAMAYVLATEARDQAIQAGDFEIYTTIGHFLTDRYGVDTHDDDIVAFGRLQNLSGRSSEWYRGLFDEIGRRVGEMHARDDFDRAVRYANVAKTLASKGADTAAVQEWIARIKDLSTLRTQFSSYKAARDTLGDDPDDAAANTKWGTYLGFLKGDFASGLPHLAKGSDTALAALAARELKPNRGAAENVAIADEWWTFGEKSKAFRPNARRHAGELYRTAMPELNGLAAAKIEKRLEEIEPAPTSSMAVDPVEQMLTTGPWLVRWERVMRPGDRNAPNGKPERDDEGPLEETITFFEGGQLESRLFVSWEIQNGFLELIGREHEGPPDFAGGNPRDHQWRGRAMLVGPELRLIGYRGDRLDRPNIRGIGTRPPVE
jgi:hypothetical protein